METRMKSSSIYDIMMSNGGIKTMIYAVLFNSPFYRVLTTIGVVVFLVLLLFFEKRLMNKNEDSLKKKTIFILYFLTLIIFICGLLFILWVWGIDIFNAFNNVQDQVIAFVTKSIADLIGTLLILFLAIFFLRISKLIMRSVGQKPGPLQKRKQTIAKLVLSIIRYIVSILALLFILSIWGINIAPALAGLGILGLVIGLGAQSFIKDLISGFFIIFEHHYDVGETVEISGFKGIITDIGLKTTKIRNWKGEIRIVNNGDISSLINFSRNPSLALVEFSIAYREDVQKTIDLLNAELPKIREHHLEIIEDPVVMGVINLADSGVNLRVMAKTENEKHYAIERAMRAHIKAILDKNGIEIPFPQVVVHHPKNEE
jgi:moderate conductance mechanosensitive channel